MEKDTSPHSRHHDTQAEIIDDNVLRILLRDEVRKGYGSQSAPQPSGSEAIPFLPTVGPTNIEGDGLTANDNNFEE